MASEYTLNRRYPLYTDSDKPNLRDQYNGAIREIDTDMAQALQDSSAVASALGSGFDAQHTVRMGLDEKATSAALTAETSARESADTALGTRITNETSARESADSSLGTRITNETSARESADTALGTRIDNEISARQSADSGLSSRIVVLEDMLSLRDQHILLLGDSYAQGVNAAGPSTSGVNWQDLLQSYLGLTHVHKYKGGSAGFISRSTSTSGSETTVPTNTTYGEILLYAYNYLNSQGLADKITHILIQGGVNDGSQTDISPVSSAITSCVAQLRQNFPNATVHIVYTCLGHTEFNSMVRRAILIPDAYNKACVYSGALYSQFTNAPWLFGDAAVSHDHSHPTEEFQRYLARFMANVLMSGTYPDMHGYYQLTDESDNVVQVEVTADHFLKSVPSFRITTHVNWSDGTEHVIFKPNTRLIAYGPLMSFPSVYKTTGLTGIGIFAHDGATGKITWVARAVNTQADMYTMDWANLAFQRRIG